MATAASKRPLAEGQALAVGHAQGHARAQRMRAAEQASGLDRRAAAIDPDDPPPRAHHGGQIAHHHARSAADLQHGVARPHGDEAQEPAAQPLLGPRPPATLQGLDEAQGIGLGVDVAEGIGMRAHRSVSPKGSGCGVTGDVAEGIGMRGHRSRRPEAARPPPVLTQFRLA